MLHVPESRAALSAAFFGPFIELVRASVWDLWAHDGIDEMLLMLSEVVPFVCG
jgi:hypothetical protein